MERNKIEEFLNSGDVEIVQLGVSLLIEQGVERLEIEKLLAPTRFILLLNSDGSDETIVKEKIGGKGIYEQMKTGNCKVVRKFDREYILEVFEKVFYNK
jgi:hypothetical protein